LKWKISGKLLKSPQQICVNRRSLRMARVAKPMALSLRFIGISWHNGECSAEPVPGEIGSGHSLAQDPRFRAIPLNDGYADYFAVLSAAEALEIARPYYESLAVSWRSVGKESSARAELQQIEAALAKATFVIAHLFEWESGLD
jgi:hypothetical protein